MRSRLVFGFFFALSIPVACGSDPEIDSAIVHLYRGSTACAEGLGDLNAQLRLDNDQGQLQTTFSASNAEEWGGDGCRYTYVSDEAFPEIERYILTGPTGEEVVIRPPFDTIADGTFLVFTYRER